MDENHEEEEVEEKQGENLQEAEDSSAVAG
jgi:hypothetical protein